jgi:CrcB protein
MNLSNISLVFIGGGAGSVLRFLLSAAVLRFQPVSWPVATLLANLSACAILALLVRFSGSISLSEQFKLLLITGFCGGLSTFSTFSYESFLLVRTGNWQWAIANILISLLLCLGILFSLVRK